MELGKISTETLRNYKDNIQQMPESEIKEKFKDILIGYKFDKDNTIKSWATYEIQCGLNYRAIRKHLGLSEV